uniref:Uncharacterized protein n=1 Tax=Aegilops tauschii subsp. strangulata TaxID=200361 RepID=A0A453EN80_AEGTS
MGVEEPLLVGTWVSETMSERALGCEWLQFFNRRRGAPLPLHRLYTLDYLNFALDLEEPASL